MFVVFVIVVRAPVARVLCSCELVACVIVVYTYVVCMCRVFIRFVNTFAVVWHVLRV